ncbi:MAG: hypothetical protein ACRD2T_13435, partial [Thermoanaerobaculia bacterium]
VEVAEAGQPLPGRFPEVREPEWPGGEVRAAPGGWLIPHAADSAFLVLNKLLAGGKAVYWLREAPAGVAGGARGDVYVPADAATPAELSMLSRETHAPIIPLGAAPSGPAYRVRPARVGLYKPWVASMDEGWTRFLLERYGFPLQSLENEEVRKGAFKGRIDVLLLPDVGKDILEKGEPSAAEARRFWDTLPPPYAGGLGEEGGKQIKKWVEEGGTLVALDSAAEYVLDLFALPARDVLAKVSEEEFHAPGSTLRVRLDPTHPLAYGLEPEEGIYVSDSPAFETAPTDARFTRRLVATYPDDARDILLSGYLKGGERLERRVALVDFAVGKGRVVLFGFRPQHRAQTLRTLKLLWNALYLGGLEEVKLP